MILLPPSDKSHSPPSQMLFLPYWAPTCFRCLVSPRPLWLVFNSSLSQCLFLYLRWTMLIFYLGKKGQKAKGTISQSSHPLLFCSVCSYHLQVPKKQINCCSSPWPRPWPNFLLQIPVPNQVLFSLFHPLYWKNENCINWSNVLFLMSVFKRGTTTSMVAPSFYTKSLLHSLISSSKPQDSHGLKKNSWRKLAI